MFDEVILDERCFFRDDYIKTVDFLNNENERFLLSQLISIVEYIDTQFFEEIFVRRNKTGSYHIFVEFWRDELDYCGNHCTPQYTLESVFISKKEFEECGILKAINRLEKKLKKYDFWKRHHKL